MHEQLERCYKQNCEEKRKRSQSETLKIHRCIGQLEYFVLHLNSATVLIHHQRKQRRSDHLRVAAVVRYRRRDVNAIERHSSTLGIAQGVQLALLKGQNE